jgi:hypothetical protein
VTPTVWQLPAPSATTSSLLRCHRHPPQGRPAPRCRSRRRLGLDCAGRPAVPGTGTSTAAGHDRGRSSAHPTVCRHGCDPTSRTSAPLAVPRGYGRIRHTPGLSQRLCGNSSGRPASRRLPRSSPVASCVCRRLITARSSRLTRPVSRPTLKVRVESNRTRDAPFRIDPDQYSRQSWNRMTAASCCYHRIGHLGGMPVSAASCCYHSIGYFGDHANFGEQPRGSRRH